MRDCVVLNDTRIAVLTRSVDAIESFLRNADFEFEIRAIEPQGSWAHGTIVRPIPDVEYDADLVVYVSYVQGKTAREYLGDIRAAFAASPRYKQKLLDDPSIRRCITLKYANDFLLDVVPCVMMPAGQLMICNQQDDTFEPTAPGAYTAWLNRKDAIVGGMLKAVTQLIKYQRDIKGTFSAKSILLTTLLGEVVRDADRDSADFSDHASALRTLVGRVDALLQPHARMPIVRNPAMPGETFTRHWDQERYDNFRKCWSRYRAWIEDAYWEVDEKRSVAKWRDVFGADFAAGLEVGGARSKGVARRLHVDLDAWVNAVAELGGKSLEAFPPNAALPYVQSDRAMAVNGVVRITATLHEFEGAAAIEAIASGDVVPAGKHLRFEAGPCQQGFEIEWRVTNTGTRAFDKGEQRGDYVAKKSNVRWERTSYRGVHFVEAFLRNRKTGLYYGKSARFFIVIERSAGPTQFI